MPSRAPARPSRGSQPPSSTARPFSTSAARRGEAGAGEFELRGDAETLARGFVALEDGLGLQVVIGHPGIDSGDAERILLAWASAATGIDLGDAYAVASESKSSPRSE